MTDSNQRDREVDWQNGGKSEHLRELEQKVGEGRKLLENVNGDERKRETLQHEAISHLEDYLAEAEVNLVEFRQVADEAWHEVVDGVRHLWERLHDAYDRIVHHHDSEE
ncbi:hypothetical protein SCOR_00060 [Sulfidibacter corallicola]|uniref:Uncharacterized protein n=1 Tax=Sulfidibacter corallicola TaxID=2818388 RepID=A0A8A4TIV0_SULCO|nr:hypothetical protein [Sulfidibacter corallicola]QTD49082.1 hypothetical protein J3U87_26140 [Sulfidibacter corallicola]